MVSAKALFCAKSGWFRVLPGVYLWCLRSNQSVNQIVATHIRFEVLAMVEEDAIIKVVETQQDKHQEP